MQSKKEKTSAQKEASEIQSTQARNEYILALSAGNAHLQHYFNTELTYLLDILEDNTIENCKGMRKLIFFSPLQNPNLYNFRFQ